MNIFEIILFCIGLFFIVSSAHAYVKVKESLINIVNGRRYNEYE